MVPQQEHVVFDNNSFESLENFLMRDEMEFIKEEDAAIPESSPLMNSEELMHTNSLNVSYYFIIFIYYCLFHFFYLIQDTRISECESTSLHSPTNGDHQ